MGPQHMPAAACSAPFLRRLTAIAAATNQTERTHEKPADTSSVAM